ncbi:MAG: hypothetical protein HYS51_00820 [Candidatus Zambryskibacteria bacterium]|nr:hypothetical protein [Candidatus Zambryskibacteria bacterium]
MSLWFAFTVLWAILLIFLAYTPVKTGSIAVVFRFGKSRRILHPGFNLIIPFLDKVEHYSTQVHQHELPDEPENIDRLHDVADPGKRLPFRIVHKGKSDAIFYMEEFGGWREKRFQDLPKEIQDSMGEDSMHAPLTSEIAVVVEWHLEGTDRFSISNFISNISIEEGRDREAEVRKRIEDMVARALQEFLGPVTLGHASERILFFSAMLKERIEVLVGKKPNPITGLQERPWGIHIKDTYIKSVYPGRRVNEARADAAAAVSKKQEAIRLAESEAQTKRVKAEADAYAEQMKGEGEAKRISAMAEVMRDDNARFIAILDVAEQVLPKTQPIILQGVNDVISNILSLGQINRR